MARQTAGRTLPGGLVIPATGLFFGADIPPSATYAQQEALIGITHFAAHRRHYGTGWDTTTGAWPWPNTGNEAVDAAERNPRVMPMIVQAATMTGANGFPVCTAGGNNGTFSNTATVSGNQGLDRVTAGEWDAKYTASFQNIKQNVPGPVLMILWQEQNIPAMGGYWQFQKKASEVRIDGINRYIRAFRHVVTLARSITSNIIFGWCPTLGVGGDTGTAMLDTYPGDSYIDIVWYDAYRPNAPLSGKDTVVRDFAISHNKVLGCAEYGDYPASLPADLSTALNYMKSTAGQEICFFVPWAISGVSDNRFDATAATLTAWKSFANDTYTQQTYTAQTQTDTPPNFSTVPTINDTTPTVGELLTASTGTVSGSPAPTFTYQWQWSSP
jgi:hypothetical protein